MRCACDGMAFLADLVQTPYSVRRNFAINVQLLRYGKWHVCSPASYPNTHGANACALLSRAGEIAVA